MSGMHLMPVYYTTLNTRKRKKGKKSKSLLEAERKHEKFLNLYHSMANETKKKHAATWKQLDKFTKILHKHKSGLHDKLHSEIVSHEVRKLYDYFNSTSGRVILGVGTEISDEEDGQ